MIESYYIENTMIQARSPPTSILSHQTIPCWGFYGQAVSSNRNYTRWSTVCLNCGHHIQLSWQVRHQISIRAIDKREIFVSDSLVLNKPEEPKRAVPDIMEDLHLSLAGESALEDLSSGTIQVCLADIVASLMNCCVEKSQTSGQ